jgi:lysophospholipase L1-like esterase
MTGITKKLISGLAFLAWVLICGEVSVRIMSTITKISNIEWLKYTNTLHAKSINPNLPYIHKASSTAHLMGVELNLNSLGHRSEDLKNPKKDGERRIYFAGNSVLLGWGVPQEDSYAKVLQKRFQEEIGESSGAHYVSINAGIGGYNTYYEAELFKDQVAVTDPDIVILQYFIKDAEDKPGGANNIIIKYSLLAATIHSYLYSINFDAAGSHKDYYLKMYEEENSGWKKARKSIKEISAICSKKNIPFFALYMPDLHDLSNEDPYPIIYQKVQRFFDEAGIPILNTLPALQREFGANPREAWVSVDDAHPSIKTHKVIGDELYDFINNLRIGEP